jgi:hypothetical protein
MIDNLYNSPCIIMWVLFNESQARHDVESLVKYIKMVDPSRLANQDSQYGVHSTYVGDVWDIHHYPNPAYVSCANKNLANVCGEYGGLKFKVDGHTWGAGDWGYATMNSRQELMDMAPIINRLPINSVKFHQLQIIKGTEMEAEFARCPEDFIQFGLEEYLDFFIDFLELLRPDLYIERFAGEVPPRFVNTSPWGKVRNVELLQMLEKRLVQRNTYQGARYNR